MPAMPCRVLRILLIALALGVLTGCASHPPSAPPPGTVTAPQPAPREGQYWDYAVRDRLTGSSRGTVRYTVVRAEAGRTVVDVRRDGAPSDTQVYAAGWNGIEHALTNLQRFRYDPPLPAYEFPLYVGKSWRRVVRATDPDSGRTYTVHVHARVVGSQRIRVPAGEFDTFHVSREIYAGNAEFFKLQEEIVQTDWYAPAVGQSVVSEATSSHIDTSRSGGGRGRPLRVRGEWLIAELVGFGPTR